MHFRLILCGSLALLSMGCAVAIPVHNGEAPESLDAWGFRIQDYINTSPESGTTRNDFYEYDQTLKGALTGLKFDFGVGKGIEVILSADSAASSGGAGIGFKYQWTGNPYFEAKKGDMIQSTRINFWGGNADNYSVANRSTNVDNVNLGAQANDISHLIGYRVEDSVVTYAGPKIGIVNMSADYRDKNKNVIGSDTRSFGFYGLLAGISVTPHGEHIGFEFNFEAQVMNFPATFSDKRNLIATFGLSVGLPFKF